jgi:hypothetical protein
MPPKKSSTTTQSNAQLGFEAKLTAGKGEIRHALIEADLVDTALRDSAFLQSEAIPQVVSAAKDNMVALPSQLFYSTQRPFIWN